MFPACSPAATSRAAPASSFTLSATAAKPPRPLTVTWPIATSRGRSKTRTSERPMSSGVVRRLRVGGLDALQFHRLHRLRNSLLQQMELRQLLGLFNDHTVELIVLMFQMRQVRLHLLQPRRKFRVHDPSLPKTPPRRT